MSERTSRRYYRVRWPEVEVPPGEPLWLHYEIDTQSDAVLRAVDVFPDGMVTRNSIELEQRNGDVCPSLIDIPWSEGIVEAELQPMSQGEFESLWLKGEDRPFWFVR